MSERERLHLEVAQQHQHAHVVAPHVLVVLARRHYIREGKIQGILVVAHVLPRELIHEARCRCALFHGLRLCTGSKQQLSLPCLLTKHARYSPLCVFNDNPA